MKYIYTLPNCRECRKRKRVLGMQSIVFNERSAGIFDDPLFDGEEVDLHAYEQ